MSEQPFLDVLIVGAGAAGLTLALDLARRHVSLRLIDKAQAPFPGSRGKGIQPRSQEVFEDLGVLDRMAAIGGPYPPQRVFREGGFVDSQIVERRAPTPAEPYGQPLMLPQNLTERVLRDRLAEFGVGVEFGCELTGFGQDAAGVTARIATPGGERTARARYLVGTDGGGSFVRRALGIEFPGVSLPGRGLVADVALDGLDRDRWVTWNADRLPEMIGLCPLAGTDLFQLQAALPEAGEPDLSDAALAAMLVERTGRADLVLRGVRWRSAFRLGARLAERYRVGRVLLAGDAAHVHPPTGGQGLNTSIQDAYNLGWKLAAALGGAPDALLDSYEAERRPVAESVLELSRKLLDGEARGERRRGREVHELDLGYFASPLTCQGGRTDGVLQPGARAPDARVEGAGGQATRLFEVFRGPQATLLRQAPQSPVAPRKGLSIRSLGPDGELWDPHGDVAAAYGLRPGEAVLVRPDGYVAAITAAGETAALEACLERMGLRA